MTVQTNRRRNNVIDWIVGIVFALGASAQNKGAVAESLGISLDEPGAWSSP